MGSSLRRIGAVARLTLREAMRRKVVLAAGLMAAAFLVLFGVGLHYAAKEILSANQSGLTGLMRREVAAQMLFIGLSTTSFLVALTAVFAAAGTLSADLDSGVIYGVLARPVRRSELVVGKFFGLASMLAIFSLLLNGTLIALARVQIGATLTTWPLALTLLVLEPMPLLALALLGSSRLPTLANGVLCTAAYGIGFVGGLIEQLGAIFNNTTMANLGIVSSLIMPLDALHRMALAALMPAGLLFQQSGPPGMGGGSTPSVWMAVYAVLYVVVLVGLAARAFSRRDL